MTNADKFKAIFGLYVTELWSKSEKEFLEWLNADANLQPTCNHLATDFERRSLNMDKLPSVQLSLYEDAVSRDAVLSELKRWDGYLDEDMIERMSIGMRKLPSVQLDISDAYARAVWAWLLDYQIKTADLKGRYTPYEVLSWVANDWRKEHKRGEKDA